MKFIAWLILAIGFVYVIGIKFLIGIAILWILLAIAGGA
jgi:hypothetical protein